MRLFSQECIIKLATLYKELNTQLIEAETNFVRSRSLTCISDGHSWLKKLIDNNSTEFVKQNQKEIQQYARSLDGNIGSCVPTVYNETSLQFALTLRDFIHNFKPNTDLEIAPKSLINIIKPGKGTISLASAKKNLDTNIKLYQCAKETYNGEKQHRTASTLVTQIQIKQEQLAKSLN